VGVLEAGRRFNDEDFADVVNLPFLVGAKARHVRIQRIHLLRNVMILAGAGVGGGSLNYATTLYVPPEPFLRRRPVVAHHDWRAELMPHYDQGPRMLGVGSRTRRSPTPTGSSKSPDEMGVATRSLRRPVGCSSTGW